MSTCIVNGTCVINDSNSKGSNKPEFMADIVPARERKHTIAETLNGSPNFCSQFDSFLSALRGTCSDGNETYKKMCMWIWCTLSVYDSIEYTNRLEGNSGNAKFCNMKCTKNGETSFVFAKFQTSLEDTDNMLADNINGYIMNHVTNMQTSKRAFMEFIDSSATIIYKDGWDNCTFELEELNPSTVCKDPSTTERYLCRFGKDQKIQRANLSLNVHIRGSGSLKEFVMEDQRSNFSRLPDMLLTFFSALRRIGEASGFCHNDAHLGNVLVRDENRRSELVLIDYGRSIFSTYLLRQDQHIITDRMSAEIAKHDETKLCTNRHTSTYDDFIKDLPQMEYVGLKCLLEDDIDHANLEYILRHVYMFDVCAISMGIIYMLQKTGSTIGNEFVEVSSTGGDITITVRSRDYITQNVSTVTHPLSQVLVPGMFWFSLFMDVLVMSADVASTKGTQLGLDADDQQYYANLKKAVLRQGDKIVVNLNMLLDLEIMHVYFQLIGMPTLVLALFDLEVKKDKARIDHMLGMFSSRGGSSRRRQKKITSRKNLLKDIKIKQVAGSRFKRYLGQHMIGGYDDSMASIKTFRGHKKYTEIQKKKINISVLQDTGTIIPDSRTANKFEEPLTNVW